MTLIITAAKVQTRYIRRITCPRVFVFVVFFITVFFQIFKSLFGGLTVWCIAGHAKNRSRMGFARVVCRMPVCYFGNVVLLVVVCCHLLLLMFNELTAKVALLWEE